ncbi:MAG: alpha/beta hydrolase [Verrucomicrobiales bacterium]|nr:alpha/beta hydrolase [Verrucomicrobiales bacterium]
MNRFRITLASLALGSLALCSGLAEDSATPEPLLLWPDGAPGALGDQDQDKPTLTPYLADPATATGAAMLVCPGGGYGGLASHEGYDYALWLNAQGISAFVLKYRLGPAGYRHPAMLNDAARGMRLIRHHAAEWHVDPHRIGVMGSSAGGHLASTLVTHHDAGDADAADPVERESSRPDLGILCYAVISMGEHTHAGSRRNLLGDDPPAELLRLLSNELQVNSQTPPCFLWHTADDPVVDVENSLDFAAALRRAGVPFALHVFQHGRHGLGLGAKPPFENPHPWVADLRYWLGVQGFLQARPNA